MFLLFFLLNVYDIVYNIILHWHCTALATASTLKLKLS